MKRRQRGGFVTKCTPSLHKTKDHEPAKSSKAVTTAKTVPTSIHNKNKKRNKDPVKQPKTNAVIYEGNNNTDNLSYIAGVDGLNTSDIRGSIRQNQLVDESFTVQDKSEKTKNTVNII